MADGAAKGAQLDALSALLATASELSEELARDPSVGRLLRAFFMLAPDDRATIASLLERAAAFRRMSEYTAEHTGIRLVPNPHARLFVRVVDAAPMPALSPQDHDELVLAGVRLTKVGVLLEQPAMRELWKQAALEAFRLVEPAEREAYARLARYIVELIDSLGDPPAQT